MRALRWIVVATFAVSHGVLVPWHLAAAHHTSAAHLLDLHVAVAPVPAGSSTFDAEHCHPDDRAHEESDHHHAPPHESGHTLEHAVDAVKTRPALPIPGAWLVAPLAVAPAPSVPPLLPAFVPRDETTFPLGPPGPSPLRARAPPRA